MAELRLDSELEVRLYFLFPPNQRDQVRAILREECGNSLPFQQNADEAGLNRIRIAVLKLSDGNLAKLREAVNLAKLDWRDLLVAAGFADDVDSHNNWFPDKRW